MGIVKFQNPTGGGWGGFAQGILQLGMMEAEAKARREEQARGRGGSSGGRSSGGNSSRNRYYDMKRKREEEKYQWEKTKNEAARNTLEANTFSRLASALRVDPDNPILRRQLYSLMNNAPMMQAAIKSVNPDRTGKIREVVLPDGRISIDVELNDGTWKPWSVGGGATDPAVVMTMSQLLDAGNEHYGLKGDQNNAALRAVAEFELREQGVPEEEIPGLVNLHVTKRANGGTGSVDDSLTSRRKYQDDSFKRMGGFADTFSESYVDQLPPGYWGQNKPNPKVFAADVKRTFASSPKERELLRINDDPTDAQMALFADLVAATRKYDGKEITVEDNFDLGTGFRDKTRRLNTRGTLSISKTLSHMIAAGEKMTVGDYVIDKAGVKEIKGDLESQGHLKGLNESEKMEMVADQILDKLGMAYEP